MARWKRGELSPFFTHQTQEVSVGVAEECHPQFMIGHLCHPMGFSLKDDAAGGQRIAGSLDIRDFEVER